jgi:hypothetical protein
MAPPPYGNDTRGEGCGLTTRRTLLAWRLDFDIDRTAGLYRTLDRGAARECGCSHCRNFALARPEHYPEAFRRLLKVLRIDPSKELSINLISPLEGSRHLYAGSYAFCGGILGGRPPRGFPLVEAEVDVFEQVGQGAHVALKPWAAPPSPWPHPCVRLDFLVDLPWLLREEGDRRIDLER